MATLPSTSQNAFPQELLAGSGAKGSVLDGMGSLLSVRVALCFMLLSLLTRLVLFVLSAPVAGAGLGAWLTAFALGGISDIAALSIALLPVAIFELALPGSWPRVSNFLRSTAFAVITFSLLFQMAAEIVFWDEFSVRFNFIAVDYLVYTHEVIDNIMQSYPVIPLVAALALAAIGLAVWIRKTWSRATHVSLQARAVVLLMLLLACAGFWSFWNIDTAAVTRNRYANELAGNGLYGLFSAYRNNELDYARYYPALPAEKLRETLKELALAPAYRAAGSAMSASAVLPAHPKHLVMIVVESLSAEYLGIFGNQEGLTPNLDRLAKEGLLFTQFYATGTRTVRGLETLSLSVPPTPGQSIVRRPHNENLATLGSALNSDGYHSWYLYGGFGYFDNMNYYFSHNGYEVLDRHDVPGNQIGYANAWGMSDEYLFAQAEKLLDREADKAPQFLMVMTTSNHRPYSYPDGRIDIRSPGGRAGAVKYTDYAIGKFLRDAQQHAWFKDTVFVVVADHCASSSGKTSLPVHRYHIPALVYAPGFVAAKQENRMVSQMDLAPTLLGILGLPPEPHFFGKDVLHDKSYIPRVLISTYQDVGYLKGEEMVVLSPRQKPRQFRVENMATDKETQVEMMAQPALVDEAIAYYQGASAAFRNGHMQLSAREVVRHVPERN